jgi:hypothetical protein
MERQSSGVTHGRWPERLSPCVCSTLRKVPRGVGRGAWADAERRPGRLLHVAVEKRGLRRDRMGKA